jgi:hypothetical protein
MNYSIENLITTLFSLSIKLGVGLLSQIIIHYLCNLIYYSLLVQTHSKKRGKLEVQRLNDIVFVQFNARINNRKISRKFDPLCAREEEHDENVRE